MSWCVSPWVYPVWDSLCLLDLIDYFLFHIGEMFNYNLLKKFLIPFLFLFFFFGTPIIWMLVSSILSKRSLRLSSVFFILFSLLWSSGVISTILYSSLLIHSSASDILLLIPSRVFLILVIVFFVSVCLFFNSCRSLVIDSHIFPFCFQGFWSSIIIILNPFSGTLPISSSSVWTSVFLSFLLHLCSISLPFHYY